MIGGAVRCIAIFPVVTLQLDQGTTLNRSIPGAASLVAAALVFGSAAALADADAVAVTAPAADSADPAGSVSLEPLQEVAITGSRIVRKDYVGNSPLTTVTMEALEASGAPTLEVALNALPQFAIGANATVAGFSGTGQATLNLRGLGPTRNLVLLDGRRLQPADVLGVVDINTIPSALVQNVEVITGGASAVYGSDAIAGVVNLQINPRFEGVQIDTQYNVFGEGDGATLDTSLTVGGNFADDRGNAVVSFSYLDREDVGYMSRDFFARARGGTDFRIPTGIYRTNVNGANLPTQAAVDQVFAQYGAAAGRVPNVAVLGYNDDGTLFAASHGPFNYRGPDGVLFDTGTQLNNLNLVSRLQVPLTRYSAFGRGSYDLSEKLTAYAQVYYTTYESLTNAEAGNDAFLVPVTNPFIPADLATILASRPDPDAPFRFEKRFHSEAGAREFNRQFDVYQLTAGLKGPIEAIDGSWDVYAASGNTQKIETNAGSVLVNNLKALLNAPDGGASLCAGGYNPFGFSQLSPECRNFLVATPISETNLEQNVIEATLQGRVLELPAGDLRFAAGAGFRSQSYDYQPDHDLALGNVVGVFRTGESRGRSDVAEVYGELLVPLLRDRLLARQLDLNVAYRYSDYDLAGGVDTYKADFSWELVDSVRLRGGYQHAVRAPSVGELFVAPNVSIPGIGNVASGGGDPCHYQSQARAADPVAARALCLAQGIAPGIIDTFVNTQDEILATSSGNTSLRPESGDTRTFGVVWTSPFESEYLARLQVSADYYDIEIEDVIGTIGAAQILPKCFNQDGSNPALSNSNFYCSQITRDPATGFIANVGQPTLNLGSYRTKGVDFQVDWAWGPFSVNTVASWLDSFEVQLQKGSNVLEYGGSVGTPSATQPGSLPDWKAVTRFQYATPAITAGLRWRYLDAMRHSSLVTNPNSTVPGVSAFNYFDLYGSWQVSDLVRVHGGVNNVDDREPPLVGTSLGSTQSSTYDIYGRQYYLAVRFTF